MHTLVMYTSRDSIDASYGSIKVLKAAVIISYGLGIANTKDRMTWWRYTPMDARGEGSESTKEPGKISLIYYACVEVLLDCRAWHSSGLRVYVY